MLPYRRNQAPGDSAKRKQQKVGAGRGARNSSFTRDRFATLKHTVGVPAGFAHGHFFKDNGLEIAGGGGGKSSFCVFCSPFYNSRFWGECRTEIIGSFSFPFRLTAKKSTFQDSTGFSHTMKVCKVSDGF